VECTNEGIVRAVFNPGIQGASIARDGPVSGCIVAAIVLSVANHFDSNGIILVELLALAVVLQLMI